MIERTISNKLKEYFSQYPILTLTGPRQSGKTTLVKALFSHLPYVNLENMLDREFAQHEPENFLNQFPKGAIIDEVQNVPNLLSALQVRIDEQAQESLFILTGSNNPELTKHTRQSLAGRTAVAKLLPLSIDEIKNHSSLTLNQQMHKGLYPRVIAKNIPATDYYSNYLETYLAQDVRGIIQISNKSLFIKFLRLAAGRVGQILNKDNLARDVGIAPSTVEQWLSILEATYIIYRLPPWHQNIGKRVIKSPKLYFYDTGLVSFLIGITKQEQLATHPLRGNLFENLQVMEVLKWKYNNGSAANLFFIRDSKGAEVDLLIEHGNEFIPIEIKSASHYDNSFMKGFKLLENSKFHMPYGKFLALGTQQNQVRQHCTILSWKNITDALNHFLN